MFLAVLIAILLFGTIIFLVARLVKEKTAEEKESAAEDAKRATPASDEPL